MAKIDWQNTQTFDSQGYQCSHCGKALASEKGYCARRQEPHHLIEYIEYICICHFCKKPTYIDMDEKQYPGVAFGNAVDEIEISR